MSYFDTASPVWGPAIIRLGPPFYQVVTPTRADQDPNILIQAGLSCSDAYDLMKEYYNGGDMSGAQVNIVQDGSQIGPLTSGMISGEGDGTINLSADGTLVGSMTYPPLAGTNPGAIAALNFLENASYGVSSGINLTVPVSNLLLSFNFDAWWARAASACKKQAPARQGLQICSNFTFQVVNSIGQVPKS